MVWLGCFIGYLALTVLALCLLYKMGEMNKEEGRWYQINFIKESKKKEAAQLKRVMGRKSNKF
ncbi:hypothetical protein [Bacillus luti]|uniref:hypothetical protein n=1 Tax=Bacillus luti TaxID=2026191 RepID=UPI00289913A5|nr:hypothetical protein [Bacillus luti]